MNFDSLLGWYPKLICHSHIQVYLSQIQIKVDNILVNLGEYIKADPDFSKRFIPLLLWFSLFRFN